MKKITWLLLIAVLPGSVQADDTITCPTDPAVLQANCNEANERIRYYEPQLNQSEQFLKNPNVYFFVSDKSGYYNRWSGAWVEFPWSYLDKATNRRYVAMDNQQLRDYMMSVHASDYRSHYGRAINLSNQRRSELLSPGGSYDKWRHYVQQLYIYRAQCCGYRWSNDVGVQAPAPAQRPPVQRPAGPGGEQSEGLLGVPFGSPSKPSPGN